jgi:enterobactin synthetase component D
MIYFLLLSVHEGLVLVVLFIKQVTKFNFVTLSNLDVFKCDFDVSAFKSILYKEFGIHYPENIKGAVNKRQSEFLAGRYCAKQALEQYNICNYTLFALENRAPSWPKGYVGSITHTSENALSVVAQDSEYAGLGIDAEDILSPQKVSDIREIITTETEYNFLKEHYLDINIAFTLVFSAKESLYKALNPIVDIFFDFQAVEIHELTQNTFKLALAIDLSSTYKKGHIFEGSYLLNKQQIITIITINKTL